MNIFMRRAGFACLAFIAVAVIFLMLPGTHIAAGGSTLDACVNGGNGMMRLVVSSADCHANETFVEWNITGPQGPPGPQGPQGPQGPAGSSAGGPPFVWVCTPANVDLGGNGDKFTEVDIVNGSATTANVAAHFLDINGNNIGGQPIPGTSGPPILYPGETGTTNVPLAPQNTRPYIYALGSGIRGTTPGLLASVIVTSDQPVVVGFAAGPSSFSTCGLLPK